MSSAAMEIDETTPLEALAAKAVSNPDSATAAYTAFILDETRTSATAAKDTEEAVHALSKLHVSRGDVDGLQKLMEHVRPLLPKMSKAKGGQLFKTLLSRFVAMPEADPALKVSQCETCIAWAEEQKRTFLRQALVVTLISLRISAKQYDASLDAIAPLLKELKRLDDKSLLVEVHLNEARAYYALGNYPKARAGLVAARTTANSIYCPPRMQASLDLQSGISHAQEGDFQTAYSYFYEAFEGFDGVEERESAVRALKYMLLATVMLEKAADVPAIISGKLALKYAGHELEALQAVADASLKRSLDAYKLCLMEYPVELKDDIIIATHLDAMEQKLLQQNLLRIVEPYSRVEISHVASSIGLPGTEVEAKLSKMILDGQLHGILDQGEGCLEVFSSPQADATYTAALGVIEHTSHVVDALYKKAQQLL